MLHKRLVLVSRSASRLSSFGRQSAPSIRSASIMRWLTSWHQSIVGRVAWITRIVSQISTPSPAVRLNAARIAPEDALLTGLCRTENRLTAADAVLDVALKDHAVRLGESKRLISGLQGVAVQLKWRENARIHRTAICIDYFECRACVFGHRMAASRKDAVWCAAGRKTMLGVGLWSKEGWLYYSLVRYRNFECQFIVNSNRVCLSTFSAFNYLSTHTNNGFRVKTKWRALTGMTRQISSFC